MGGILDSRRRSADAGAVKSLWSDRDPRALVLGVVALAVAVVGAIAGQPALGLIAGVLALALAVMVPSAQPLTTAASVAQQALQQAQPQQPEAETPVPAPTPQEPATSPLAAPSVISLTPATASEPAAAPGMYVPSAGTSSLVDPLTGLYTQEYFEVAIETRVLAARRNLRPVAIVLFDVVEGVLMEGSERADPVPIADAIRRTLREADTACRLADGRFAFVLEDTPEDGAMWTVERVRRALNPITEDQTRWAGIACYPAHAFNAKDTLAKAEEAFLRAREWAQDRIEVAIAD